MSKKIDANNLSNAEIRIQLETLEHEYNAQKVKLKEMINHLSQLNSDYVKLQEVLNKRSKGFI